MSLYNNDQHPAVMDISCATFNLSFDGRLLQNKSNSPNLADC